MQRTGIVILIHGSRGEQAITGLPEAFRRITEGVKALLSPGTEVLGAALQFNHPDLEETVAIMVSRSVEKIVIMPYFLFSGRHITEDIPELIEKMKNNYPGINFVMAEPLGSDSDFIDNIMHCIEKAVPELRANYQKSSPSPEEIEIQSMEIVENLIPSKSLLSPDERTIVKRIVHASGDPDIASLVRFSSSAISSGLNAIANSGHIYTDVNMVASGISKHLTDIYGYSVSCALDISKDKLVIPNTNTTRAATAIYNLGKRLNDSIVVIGNAPTALMSILEMIDKKEILPALVIGMPVGFVQAKESKYELMKFDIPYITIIGTRGGSAVAAATVNALLKISTGRKMHNQSTLKRKEI